MTTTRTRRSRLLGAVAAAGVAVLGLTACGAPTIAADSPAFTPAPATPVPTLADDTCDNARQSYDPYPSLSAPAVFRNGTLQQEIRSRGRLVVGVSGDSKLLGSRDPENTSRFEGFDIDLANAVAKAIFGSDIEGKIQYRVITAAQRIPLVNEGAGTKAAPKGGVDLIARNMTINCARWEQVAFSATYLVAEQQVLIRTDNTTIKSLDDLGPTRARVCAPAGSTSIQRIVSIDRFKDIVPVEVDQHTTCLALLQQGRVDAITGDSTVLAGLNAQDPKFTRIFKDKGDSLGQEPYGLAVAKDHPEFARFLNTVLADYIAGGGWQKAYDTYFSAALGPGTPPTPQYGRPLP